MKSNRLGKLSSWGVFAAISSLVVAMPCYSREIVVDPQGDYASISQAVSAAKPGDTVTIRPGVYREEVLLEGTAGTAEEPILVQADPAAAPGSVAIDGSRVAGPDKWQQFLSERFGIDESHNIWWTGHDPEEDCSGNELMQNCYPYKLHAGWYGWDGERGGSARWGTCQLFENDIELELVPNHPRAGLMADLFHVDSEETQSEAYLTASNPKFLKPAQWIWHDDGRTDGSDEDLDLVSHAPEIQHRIFVRLPKGQTPRDVELSYTVRSTCLSLAACSHLTFRGLRVRRALTGISVARKSHAIRLENLIVEEFGGGRKFYYSPASNEHIYSSGVGIQIHSSSCDIAGCLVQNGRTCGISAWGQGDPEQRLSVRYSTIRNIGPHGWGGGWAHGKGKGIGTGNFHNVLVANNVIQDCADSGYWADGAVDDHNIKIIANRFENCRNIGIFSERPIDEILVAYNTVLGGDRCFRIGPISRRSRIIGNLFAGGRVGGTTGVMKSRMEGRTDTIDWFALVGNVISDSKYACFVWTDDALLSPHFYWDHNLWHASETAHSDGPLMLDWRPKDLDDMWAALRPKGNFLAAGEHGRFVEESPVKRLQGDRYRVPVKLVTSALLDDLKAKGFLTSEDVTLLKAWHPSRTDEYAEGTLAMGPLGPVSLSLPEDWQGPGAPQSEVLPAQRRYGNRAVSDFPIRINVGYSWGEIVDSEGNTWLPDQIHVSGTYGYIGSSQVRRPQQVLTNVEIEDTENDEVYRTGRIQLTRYFVAVPDGTYDIVLHFACLTDGKLWHPTIDVKIEEETVVAGLHAGPLGRLTATSQRCESVRVNDGVLDVELTQSDMALCGIEIVRE